MKRELRPATVWGALLAAAAMFLYLATLAPGIFWLDSAELVAAAHTLGVSHPPGQPLYMILAKLASLVPLGSVAIRMGLLSTLLGVSSLLVLYALTLRAARGDDRSRDAVIAPAAALGVVVLGAAPALWFQSIRAEVYTLNLLVCLLPLLLLSRREDARGLAVPVAAFLVGLGLTNHHLLVLLATPAALWLVATSPSGRRWLRPGRLALLVAIGAMALLPYALLPLRARLLPDLAWGDASSLRGLFDVVSARVFQTSLDPSARAGLGDNLVTAALLFMDHLTPVVALAGVAGLALLVRRRPRLGVALILLLAGSVASKVLMLLDPQNPDDHGYFSAAMAVLALGASVLLAAIADAIAQRWRGRVTKIVVVTILVALSVGAGAWQVTRYSRSCDLSELRGPDTVVQATLEAVPPDALVLPYYYALHFTLLYAQCVEERRPDVALVHQTFAANIDDGAPYRRWLRHAHPDWRGLADAWERADAFPTAWVLNRAHVRPIYIEPFTTLVVPPEDLEATGMLARVRPRDASRLDPTARREWRERYWAALLDRLGDEPARFWHTRVLLLWSTYLEAALHLRRGDVDSARLAIARGLALSPNAGELVRLQPWLRLLDEAHERRAKATAAIATPAPGLNLRSLVWLVTRPRAAVYWLRMTLADEALRQRLATTNVQALPRF